MKKSGDIMFEANRYSRLDLGISLLIEYRVLEFWPLVGGFNFWIVYMYYLNKLVIDFRILCERPKVVLHIAHTVVKRLSPFVRQVDFALDWVFLESGRAVYRYEIFMDNNLFVCFKLTQPSGFMFFWIWLCWFLLLPT